MRVSFSHTTCDKIADYIPLCSTAKGFIDLFWKYAVIPRMSKEAVAKSHYYTHLTQKSLARCLIVCVPILGNIIIALYDLFGKKAPEKKTATLLRETKAESGHTTASSASSATAPTAKPAAESAPPTLPPAAALSTEPSIHTKEELDTALYKAASSEDARQVFCQASDKLRDTPDVILALLYKANCNLGRITHDDILRCASDRLKNDQRFMEDAIASGWSNMPAVVRNAAPALRKNKAFAFCALHLAHGEGACANSQTLGCFDLSLRDDEEVVTVATQRYPMAIQFASDRLKSKFSTPQA